MSSKLREYFKGLSKGKLIFRLSLIFIPFLMYTGLIIYIFTIPGDKGVIMWVDWVRQYVMYAVYFNILLFVLIGIDFLIATLKKAEIKRIPSIFLMIFLILGFLISAGGFGYLATVPLRRAGDKAPQLLVLNGVGANGVPNMAVTYYTQEKTTNTLYWGETPSLELVPKTEPKAVNRHGFLLDTLEPNKTYYYRINAGTIYNFNTPEDTLNYARFAISSDTHFGASNANRSATLGILENVVAYKYDILFHLGDMVEYGLFDSQYKEAMDYFSPYVTSIPYRPAIGNHDTLFGGKALWRDYFSPDLIEDAPTDYFHIELNGVHVFVLDLEWGTETYTRAQSRWFENELTETSVDDWILVMNHAMYYSSGYFVDGKNWWDNVAMINEFEDLFIQYDVDLVFSGHNHHMEYLNNSGVVYNIIGGFGGALDRDFQAPENNLEGEIGQGSLWYHPGEHGFLDVEINGTTADVRFRNPEYVIVKNYTVMQ